MSVWAHKPVAVYTSFTELNTPSVSLSLSTEEPKLVQRKSHLVFIHFINTCDSVSPLWVYMCADFSSRHVGDPWKSLGVVLETSVAHEMKGCCPWPCLLEHQITYVGYWSSRQEWRGLKRATSSDEENNWNNLQKCLVLAVLYYTTRWCANTISDSTIILSHLDSCWTTS